MNGMKLSKSKCIFSFKRHRVSGYAASRRSSTTLYADGRCSVPTCPVTFNLYMHSESDVTVKYNGNIRHPLLGRYARPIRKKERNDLKQEFRLGKKPYAHFLKTVASKSGEELLSGNFDGIGKSPSVLKNIACESRQTCRLEKNVHESLIKFQERLVSDNVDETKVKGFVQLICVKPINLCYWTCNGIRLWHELSKSNAVYFDATGSIVKQFSNDKRILYYEVSIKCPGKGNPSVPVAAMLSSEHDVATISSFLSHFRRSEKFLFGYKNLSQPCVIKVDFSMALISSVLEIFNMQALHDYLEYCWKIVNGLCSSSNAKLCKTVVHVCLGHFMKCVKDKCFKISKCCTDIALYSFGLMCNASSMQDIKEIFGDLYVILSSKYITPLFQTCFDRAQKKIKTYSSSSVELTIDSRDVSVSQENGIDVSQSTDDINVSNEKTSHPSKSRVCFNEEEFLSTCEKSSFLCWTKSFIDDLKLMIEQQSFDCLTQTNFILHCLSRN